MSQHSVSQAQQGSVISHRRHQASHGALLASLRTILNSKLEKQNDGKTWQGRDIGLAFLDME